MTDHFCFSYDGDDTATKPEPSALPDFQPEPVQAPNPTGNGVLPTNVNQEPKAEDQTEFPIKDEPIYGNGHNEDAGPAWNGGQGNEGQSNLWNDAPMEEESRGIGIKEDG